MSLCCVKFIVKKSIFIRLSKATADAAFSCLDFEYIYIIYMYISIYLYTTVLPLSCSDGRYFYHISGTALFSGTNYDFFCSIVIFLLHFGYNKSKSRKLL